MENIAKYIFMSALRCVSDLLRTEPKAILRQVFGAWNIRLVEEHNEGKINENRGRIPGFISREMNTKLLFPDFRQFIQ